jgi:hypothetical protein
MFSLEHSKTFLDDYNKFKYEIDSISDIDKKSELNGLLRKLHLEVKKIDMHHLEINPHNQLGQKADDTKSNINSIRNQIKTKLKEYKKHS